MEQHTTSEPTFGIEIEIPWRAMLTRFDNGRASRLLREQGGFYNLTDTDKAYVQKIINSVERHYDERVKTAVELGVPTVGNDGYKEFALHPRHTTKDTLKDVQILQDLDLVRDNEHYPLHLTIGGLAVNASAYYLLASTEIYGNIRPMRFTQQHTWAQKGRGGVKWRFPHELQLEATEGVEFRTLEYNSMTQLADMLHIAETGSRAIVSKHPLWQSWRNQLAQHHTDAGLPVGEIWQNADHDLWQRYADALGDTAWQQEAKHIIGRHAALLSIINPRTSASNERGRDHLPHDGPALRQFDARTLRRHVSAHQSHAAQ